MDGRASVSMDERCIVTERGWTEMELRWTAVATEYIVDGWMEGEDGWTGAGKREWPVDDRCIVGGTRSQAQAWQLRMGFRLACTLAHDAFPFHACLLVFH